MSSKNKFVVISFLLTYTQGFGNEETTYDFAAEGPQQYTVRQIAFLNIFQAI